MSFLIPNGEDFENERFSRNIDINMSMEDEELDKEYEAALKEFDEIQDEFEEEDDLLSIAETQISEIELDEEQLATIRENENRIKEFEESMKQLKTQMDNITYTDPEELKDVPTLEEIRKDYLANKLELDEKFKENQNEEIEEISEEIKGKDDFLTKLEKVEEEFKSNEDEDLSLITSTLELIETRTKGKKPKKINEEKEEKQISKHKIEPSNYSVINENNNVLEDVKTLIVSKKKDEINKPIKKEIDEKENDEFLFETPEEIEIVKQLNEQKRKRKEELKKLKEAHKKKQLEIKKKKEERLKKLKEREEELRKEEEERQKKWEEQEKKRKFEDFVLCMQKEEQLMIAYITEKKRRIAEQKRLLEEEKKRKEREEIERKKRKELERKRIQEEERRKREEAKKRAEEKRKREEIIRKEKEKQERIRLQKLAELKRKRLEKLKREKELEQIKKKKEELRKFREKQKLKLSIQLKNYFQLLKKKFTNKPKKKKPKKIEKKYGKIIFEQMKHQTKKLTFLQERGKKRTIKTLERLDLSNRRIQSLDEIRSMHSNQYIFDLDLSKNKIESIDARNDLFLVYLESLDLSDNQIFKIPSFSLLFLRSLNLSKNKIKADTEELSQISLFAPCLTTLNISFNELTSLGFLRYFKILKTIDLSYNNIGSIEELENLKHSRCLDSLTLKKNPVMNKLGSFQIKKINQSIRIFNGVNVQPNSFFNDQEHKFPQLSAYEEAYVNFCHYQSNEIQEIKNWNKAKFEGKWKEKTILNSNDIKKKKVAISFILKEKEKIFRDFFVKHLEFQTFGKIPENCTNIVKEPYARKKEKEILAGRIICAAVKRKMEMKKKKFFEAMQVSVVLVQSVWRRNLVFSKELQKKLELSLSKKNKAATKIQAVWKSYIVRKKLREAQGIDDDLNFTLNEVQEEFDIPLEFQDTSESINLKFDDTKHVLPFRSTYMRNKYAIKNEIEENLDEIRTKTPTGVAVNNFFGSSTKIPIEKHERKIPKRKINAKKQQENPEHTEPKEEEENKEKFLSKKEFIKNFVSKHGPNSVNQAEMYWRRKKKSRIKEQKKKRSKKMRDPGFRLKKFQELSHSLTQEPLKKRKTYSSSGKTRSYIPNGKLGISPVVKKQKTKKSKRNLAKNISNLKSVPYVIRRKNK